KSYWVTKIITYSLNKKRLLFRAASKKNNESLFLKKQRAYKALPKIYHIL
ncbi:hypothetical protein A5804_002948, partial [Enterococcus faecium]